jgi:endonuclease/exonuclease/phosphatase family metal-dependent hydrolase
MIDHKPGDLRVATLNLWGRHEPWATRRSVLIDRFRDLQPDVVALQEVISDDGYDEAADVLGPEYRIVHQRLGLIGDGYGVAIGRRWPVGDVREVDLHQTSRTADFPCTTRIAEIVAPAPIGSFLFVNHFPNWQLNLAYEREVQTVAAARAIEDLVDGRECHVILAGDLDADSAAAIIRFWSGRQSLGGMSVCYRDAWESAHPEDPGHSFTPCNPYVGNQVPDWPFRRIDYLFLRCAEDGPTLNIATCAATFDEPRTGVWGSDHFGVVANLAVRTRHS